MILTAKTNTSRYLEFHLSTSLQTLFPISQCMILMESIRVTNPIWMYFWFWKKWHLADRIYISRGWLIHIRQSCNLCLSTKWEIGVWREKRLFASKWLIFCVICKFSIGMLIVRKRTMRRMTITLCRTAWKVENVIDIPSFSNSFLVQKGVWKNQTTHPEHGSTVGNCIFLKIV